MDLHIIFEIVGYTGSVFAVLSMMMSSMIKLRYLNTIGCLLNFLYALLIVNQFRL